MNREDRQIRPRSELKLASHRESLTIWTFDDSSCRWGVHGDGPDGPDGKGRKTPPAPPSQSLAALGSSKVSFGAGWLGGLGYVTGYWVTTNSSKVAS